MFVFLSILVIFFEPIWSCAGGIGGGGILTNPSINMKFHPPTAWTYPDSSAINDVSYFPGQSMAQSEAQLRANGDLNSAVLAGLNALQIPTTSVTVTSSYTPPLINDCIKGGTNTAGSPLGAIIGIEEGGAITKTLTLPAIVNPQNCAAKNYGGTATTPLVYTEFIQQASVKIDGITLSEYQASLLAAKVSSYLQLNSKVDFIEEPLVN